MSKKMKSDIMLLITAIIWGSAFVAQRAGADVIGPFTFNALRYIWAFLFLIPVIIILDKKNLKDTTKQLTKDEKALEKKYYIRGGIACGIALTLASSVQQLGMAYTTAGKAGFITALYMVFVPIFGIFLGNKARPIIWFCVAIAAVGLYLLSIKPGTFSISKGDFIILICAFCFTAHILVIDHYSPKTDGVRMSCIQFLVAFIISGILMLITEPIVVKDIITAAFPIFYAGVFSAGIGYTLQIVAQKDADPAVASLILSLESVFAVIAGVLLLHESLSGREALGCLIMFVAIILSQLPSKEDRETRKLAHK